MCLFIISLAKHLNWRFICWFHILNPFLPHKHQQLLRLCPRRHLRCATRRERPAKRKTKNKLYSYVSQFVTHSACCQPRVEPQWKTNTNIQSNHFSPSIHYAASPIHFILDTGLKRCLHSTCPHISQVINANPRGKIPNAGAMPQIHWVH